MAPIKFEEHIKDRLKEREIRPTASAWDRISEDLEIPEEHKKTPFFWYGIAASFIGLLIVSIVFFKSENPLDDKNNTIVVSTEEKEVKDSSTKKGASVTETRIEEKYAEVEVSKADNVLKKQPAIDNNNIEEEILVQVDERTPLENQQQKVFYTPEKVIEAKLVEVLAQASTMETNSDALTDAEVDSLLRQAQRELLEDKIFKKGNTVDAMALLSDVENELDQSFRDQIFEKLKTGFFKVRTAVADRNN